MADVRKVRFFVSHGGDNDDDDDVLLVFDAV
jgi:hypothetical protein